MLLQRVSLHFKLLIFVSSVFNLFAKWDACCLKQVISERSAAVMIRIASLVNVRGTDRDDEAVHGVIIKKNIYKTIQPISGRAEKHASLNIAALRAVSE